MTREQTIKLLETTLLGIDIHNSSLVNFRDDEVYWDKIAKACIETIETAFNQKGMPWEPQ
jgi:hypothetical protein